MTPTAEIPRALWKRRTAAVVLAPNAPSIVTRWPALTRCSCAHTTGSPCAPCASRASEGSGVKLLSEPTGCEIAPQTLGVASCQSHQLTPGAPYDLDS